MPHYINVPLPQEQLEELISDSKDFIYTHGILMRSTLNTSHSDSVIHEPYTLFPSPVPRACFNAAQSVQTDFNLLLHRVANDREFLGQCLKNVMKVDEFTKHLFDIYRTIQDERVSKVPYVNSATAVAKGFHEAWKLYGNPRAAVILFFNSRAAVMFLSDPVERCIYDHRWIEYALNDLDPSVKVIRRSLEDVKNRGHMDHDRNLTVDGHVIAVVYQRSCYTPEEFPTDKHWSTLLMMERSRAVLCPSVGYHLAGRKKVQQELAAPGVVERLMDNDLSAAARIRATFAQQYTLDLNPVGDDNVKMGIADPERFVLKPQREGGGNNIFGADVGVVLSKLKNTPERAAYVLMERFQPITIKNYPIMCCRPISDADTNGTVPATQLTDMITELGVFGVLLEYVFKTHNGEMLINEMAGHMMRTKKVGTNEGGISTGYAVVDSAQLVD